MSDPRRQSPLCHRNALSGDEGAMALKEVPFVGKIALRGERHLLSGAFKSVLSLDLPGAGSSTTNEKVSVLWLSPDEWLILTEPGAEDAIQATLQKALWDVHAQLANVTDYYTVISLIGPSSRDCLAKITPFDLTEASFGPGAVAGSIFAHVASILFRRDDENGAPAFDLLIRWSHADYLYCMLSEAGYEYGFERQKPAVDEQMVIPD